MNTHAEKTQESKSQSASNVFLKQSVGESKFQFIDNRPKVVAQRKLQEIANYSPQALQMRAFRDMACSSPRAKQVARFRIMEDGYTLRQQPQIIQKKVKSMDAHPVIQLTSWRYIGGTWNMESSSSSDTNAFDLPDNYCTTNGIKPAERDKYDQDTERYYSWDTARLKTEKRAKRKKDLRIMAIFSIVHEKKHLIRDSSHVQV